MSFATVNAPVVVSKAEEFTETPDEPRYKSYKYGAHYIPSKLLV